jgi:hypothetical protein
MEAVIKRGNIYNKDALWKWIKKECLADNVEEVKCENIIESIPVDNSILTLTHLKGRILTIKLGDKR